MKLIEVLVIGAGPAGIAAATAAAENGRRVLLLDDNTEPGGQIWRAASVPERYNAEIDSPRAKALARLQRSGAMVCKGRRVFAADARGVVQALHETVQESRVEEYRFEQLILATGARERFLPFPGWTTPGVFGPGGLQALVRGGFPIEGKRVVIAGTGPLLLAVAAHLAEAGATIRSVAEQAKAPRLLRFGLSLWSHPSKVWQGMRYRKAVWRSPFRTGSWVSAALPGDNGNGLRAVRLTDGKRTWEESCDVLACGYHLVPNMELASLLGCELVDGFVRVDDTQQTSKPNVYCVGEPVRIAGFEAAQAQGTLAGLACAGASLASAQARVRAEQIFGERLATAFALRPELRAITTPDTIVCRCEDVQFKHICGREAWTDAKLQSRCGMGPCQARICGPAIEFLKGWRPMSVREPLFPVPISAFCTPGTDVADQVPSSTV